MEQNNFANKETKVEVTSKKLFHKDFTLVVLGQIISLFGNAILRFALPLYILEISGSAALFGAVSAMSFLPMIVMSPIGGMIADRMNKQRMMVVLDFFTAGLILFFMLTMNSLSIIPLVMVVMMVLYGIQGAYSPAVQSSLPLLASEKNLMSANAVVNTVSSLAGLFGPVLGGLLYGQYGLLPIVIISCGCFAFSAVMELFIRIPHEKRPSGGSVWSIVKADMTQSFRFILKDKPILAKVILLIFLFNVFLSAMLSIGLPVMITQILKQSSQLYGISQGVMAAGGLLGGLLAGVAGNKLKIRHSYILLLFCGLGVLPMGIVLWMGVPPFVSYVVITALTSLLMAAATLFSIQMLAFVQAETPTDIVGKVLACLMALSTCAQPIGQAVYGVLFEALADSVWIILLGTALITCVIAVFSKKSFAILKAE